VAHHAHLLDPLAPYERLRLSDTVSHECAAILFAPLYVFGHVFRALVALHDRPATH
jgi:hypothetical protein